MWCKNEDKMKHDWEFVRVVSYGLNDHNPISAYVCKRCGVNAEVHINNPSTMIPILRDEDCKGQPEKKVDNSPGAMLDRASDTLAYSLDERTFTKDLRYVLEAIIVSCMLNNNRIDSLEDK